MSGVAFEGYFDADFGWDAAADYIGQTIGLGVPFKSYPPDGVLKPPELFTTGGEVTADGGSGLSPDAATAFAGADFLDESSFAVDWFEAVHLLPRTKIEFGNIITQVEDTYEIYSAFRSASVSENVITNNALPGINLPDNSPTVVFPPQTSLLDSSTTGQTTSALGTIVPAKVQALANGLPNFDTDIVFEFLPPANDVTLLVTGSRIVLIPYEYEIGVKESLAFRTDIIPARNGKEQRISTRKQPRQAFNVEYALDLMDRQRLHTLLFEWMSNTFGFPLWDERLTLSSATIIGATTYPVTGGDDIDMRVGGLAAVITDPNVFDVFEVDTMADTLVTAGTPAINAYPAGTPIMPVRTALIPHKVALKKAIANMERFRVTFDVLDNDTGAPTGDVTPGFWSTYNGRVLFDDCNVVGSSGMSGSLQQRVYRLDNQTGVFEHSSIWDISKHASEKGFLCRSRAEIMALRKLFIGLDGRQKVFYLPTFFNDLTLNDDLGSGVDTMDIESVDYVRFAQDRFPMTVFRITFTDDTSLVRIVQSSTTVSTTVERLTLDTTWPSAKTVAEVALIEWYELVRFDSDVLNFLHARIGQASAKMPVMRVFDDN